MVNKFIHVYSGGLDSTVLLYDLLNEGHEVVCLNFHYGSTHNIAEHSCAINIAKRQSVELIFWNLENVGEYFKSGLLVNQEDIPDGHYEEKSMKRTIVPFRNGILLSIAAGLADSMKFDAVSYAAHAGDHAVYYDCTSAFFKSMSDAIRRGTARRIRLTAPYMESRKEYIVKRGAELCVPFELTWSCYKGEYTLGHCGTCGTCVERKEAFQLAGVSDPTVYQEETNGKT